MEKHSYGENPFVTNSSSGGRMAGSYLHLLRAHPSALLCELRAEPEVAVLW